MRWMTLGICLFPLMASAIDAGVTPAKPPKDAGRPDAGLAAKAPGAWAAKPIFLLAEDEKAIDKYALAKPSERAAVKGILQKLTVGKRAAAAILLEGYELPQSRRADLSADLVVMDPTGRTVIDKVSVSVAKTMDPQTMILVPLKPVFGMVFGLTDLEGEYQVRITVWDHVRGSSTNLETKFQLTR